MFRLIDQPILWLIDFNNLPTPIQKYDQLWFYYTFDTYSCFINLFIEVKPIGIFYWFYTLTLFNIIADFIKSNILKVFSLIKYEICILSKYIL